MVDEHLSGFSQALAIEIVKSAVKYGTRLRWNALESLHWAVDTLRQLPTQDAILPLTELWLAADTVGPIDSSWLNFALSQQPWNELAERIYEAPTGDPGWDAYVLCFTACIACGPVKAPFSLSADRTIDYYLHGLQRCAQADDIAMWRQTGYLEQLAEAHVARLVEGVTTLLKSCDDERKLEILQQLERALRASGYLADYVDAVRVPYGA
jgi:hypothetical protein